MRVREFSNSQQSGSVITTLYQEKSSSWTRNYSYVAQLDYDVMFDIVTPEFEKKKSTGELAFNPMSRFTVTKMTEPCVYDMSGYLYGGVVTKHGAHAFTSELQGVLNSDSLIRSYFLGKWSNERNIAIAQAWANVDETELLASASLGELPETVKFIADIFRRFIAILKVFISKKSRLKALTVMRQLNSKKAAESSANLWLEFRYAVRPLIFEAHSALAALEYSRNRELRHTARGKCISTTKTSGPVTVKSASGTYEDITYNHAVETRYEARAGVMYSIDTSASDLSLAFGLGNNFETLWELTPFSFIIDWFLNIGDIISAWEKNASLGVLGSWVVEKELVTERNTLTNVSFDRWVPLGYTISNVTWQNATQEVVKSVQCRTITTERPIIPSFKMNLDASKILDLATIAAGLLKIFKN